MRRNRGPADLATCEAHRARLDLWLREWTLEVRLRAGMDTREQADGHAGAPADAVPCPALPAWRRPRGRLRPTAAGDILLLPPDGELTRQRPVYVVVLTALRPGVWLACPFSRFSVPATPGELVTGRAATPLRVLCVWNTGAVAETRLRAGWHVGRLTLRERRRVERLRGILPGVAAMPSELAARVGPPLVHPLDPRHLYLEEERALWAGRAAVSEAPGAYDGAALETWLLAAETEAPYGRRPDSDGGESDAR